MKSKRIAVPVLIFLMLLNLLSCKKDSRTDDAVADVYVKSIISNGVPVYGIVHYVNGSSPISVAMATTPDGASKILSSYDDSKLSFYTEPSETAFGDYTNIPPIYGVYTYKVTFTDGVEKSVTNTLGAYNLPPATMISLEKTIDGQFARLTWAELASADYYQLQIYKAGVKIYTSAPFTPRGTLDFPINSIPSYAVGNYTFELDAIDYETSAADLIQSVSVATISANL